MYLFNMKKWTWFACKIQYIYLTYVMYSRLFTPSLSSSYAYSHLNLVSSKVTAIIKDNKKSTIATALILYMFGYLNFSQMHNHPEFNNRLWNEEKKWISSFIVESSCSWKLFREKGRIRACWRFRRQEFVSLSKLADRKKHCEIRSVKTETRSYY